MPGRAAGVFARTAGFPLAAGGRLTALRLVMEGARPFGETSFGAATPDGLGLADPRIAGGALTASLALGFGKGLFALGAALLALGADLAMPAGFVMSSASGASMLGIGGIFGSGAVAGGFCASTGVASTVKLNNDVRSNETKAVLNIGVRSREPDRRNDRPEAQAPAYRNFFKLAYDDLAQGPA